MLKLECPRCKEWIYSPFLAEMDEVQCPVCSYKIRVEEVYVTAGPYSIYRDVLLKHLYKYKRLLSEAVKELDEIQKEGRDRRHNVSADTVKLFISNLKEMLDGCRSACRVILQSVPVKYVFNNVPYDAGLINISFSGVCIDATGAKEIPQKGNALSLQFDAALSTGPFQVQGEVMWSVREKIGIRFTNVDNETKKRIQDYISEKS